MAGRAHLYEGYTPQQVTFGVRVLRALGVRSMVFTNAAGGINLALERGGLVLISDHINLQGANPLIGPNDDALGPRFPDMSEAYSRRYREIAKAGGAANWAFRLSEGVYAAMLGPSYETPAEIRYLRAIGADLVGMSTVPEVIVANHMGMKVLGISCVTNMAAGILPQKINHEEVLETGAMVRDTLVRFLKAAAAEAGGVSLDRSADRRRARRARERVRAVLEVQGGRGARRCRRPHPHRLQRGERHLRADGLRRARRRLQGDLRRRAQVPPRRGGRRYRHADAAVRRLPADPLGVLRRRRAGAGQSARQNRNLSV